MQNHLKDEIHNVLSGKSKVKFGTIIQTIASYLNDGEGASKVAENEKQYKKQETERLEDYLQVEQRYPLQDFLKITEAWVTFLRSDLRPL